ncbi:TolC family protein [Fluviicola taffensis]|uniref:Outer membrane efflux protein n=1 Tax=Fluviicola taffensis (strain DSM 16823 / NCIMB 13979 / RW262) TaxID=755732 RepID=F2IE53_FLUTR|nr:TolC family protein [Fluviicola taffensis]AEA42371.1 outer membrane efflux protein [Fluviicola taffensis DSM 16823]
MKQFILLFLILSSRVTLSQQILSFEEVIKRTLANNFDVLIQRNNTKVADNSNNIGTAGYLPTVAVNADQSWTFTNTRQEFFSGQINEKNGARNNAFTAAARLNWTLFDGFAMFARDKRLQLSEDLATVNLTAQMEMSIYQASILYYSIQYYKRMQTVYEEAIQLSKERFDLISLKSKNGAANDLELLQAKLDLNTDSSNYLNHLNLIIKTKADLASVMGDAGNVQFDVDEIIPVLQPITQSAVLESALAQNTSILIQKSQIAIIDQQRKELKSRYYPQLSFYAQYTTAISQSEVGLLSSNRSLGPGFGFTLNWTILDGLSNVTAVKNNQLQKENAELTVQKQEQTIKTEVEKAWQDYVFSERMFRLENSSIINTTEMFEIAQKSFENGSLTQFELREIQFSIIQAKNRQLSAEFNLRTAALNLALFTGNYKNLIP